MPATRRWRTLSALETHNGQDGLFFADIKTAGALVVRLPRIKTPIRVPFTALGKISKAGIR